MLSAYRRLQGRLWAREGDSEQRPRGDAAADGISLSLHIQFQVQWPPRIARCQLHRSAGLELCPLIQRCLQPSAPSGPCLHTQGSPVFLRCNYAICNAVANCFSWWREGAAALCCCSLQPLLSLRLSSHPASPKDAAVPCLWGPCDALDTFTLTSPCPHGRYVGARRENQQEKPAAAQSCGHSEHSGHCCSPRELPAGEQQGWLR